LKFSSIESFLSAYPGKRPSLQKLRFHAFKFIFIGTTPFYPKLNVYLPPAYNAIANLDGRWQFLISPQIPKTPDGDSGHFGHLLDGY
jgi:hypothetical protein